MSYQVESDLPSLAWLLSKLLSRLVSNHMFRLEIEVIGEVWVRVWAAAIRERLISWVPRITPETMMPIIKITIESSNNEKALNRLFMKNPKF